MAGATLENMLMIKRRVEVFLHGQTGDHMKDNGSMASSMGRAFTSPIKAPGEKVDGQTVKG